LLDTDGMHRREARRRPSRSGGAPVSLSGTFAAWEGRAA